MAKYTWSRDITKGGYEVTSRGDARFSAFGAAMSDGRTIEMWYQCDIKGYAPGSKNWREGKGKPSIIPYPGDELYLAYKTLWRIWAINNVALIEFLIESANTHNNLLTDRFASTPINQARALAEIITEWTND